MREIKFRVWDKNKSKMNYDITGFECSQNIIDGVFIDGEYFDLKNGVLMQYTGLKDKNGVEIYEGDVVKNNWTSYSGKDLSEIWEIRFGEYDNSDIEYGSGGNIGFYAYSLKNGDEEGLNNLPCNNNDGIEIIGNIYEDLKESGE